MARLRFGEAIDAAVAAEMARDPRVVVIGEDVHLLRAPLYARFGAERVLAAPISEAAFVGAAVGAAMAGLRPVVELMLVDFLGSCLDAVLNQMAKIEAFSGGGWTCPLVVRATCGGGYGDGGQHEQALWGLLSGIPGLTVVVPSTPADAAGLLTAAIRHDGPVFFLEHKLLSESWLEYLGRGGRDTVTFDVPADGAEGEVDPGIAIPIGRAAIRRTGGDLTIVSLAVGVHRALAAADVLAKDGLACEVLDLRTTRPLDRAAVAASVARTGRLLVVDEDYREAGLSGELAAVALEAGLAPRFGRVCVEDTLPYARPLEDAALPGVARIVAAARRLVA
ncbi:alpha-ketoacid dehydrogenase subunit beta [Anaeromyxobacter oryzae]|uniref:Pyruvate dehydrogenase E1 component subunit beta n=1 Tax=Anaeromyxobacter oryzae TaxID=2918170 RepID=A0ABM7X2F3_9BACT|nr:transketolase C-terminal domain-containing protein [Anaeromyxobacter oryzae]BDG05963.1 pyruvate dehydrogenase E1 component subunit beta [Anaeromyxobacter oryzae]